MQVPHAGVYACTNPWVLHGAFCSFFVLWLLWFCFYPSRHSNFSDEYRAIIEAEEKKVQTVQTAQTVIDPNHNDEVKHNNTLLQFLTGFEKDTDKDKDTDQTPTANSREMAYRLWDVRIALQRPPVGTRS